MCTCVCLCLCPYMCIVFAYMCVCGIPYVYMQKSQECSECLPLPLYLIPFSNIGCQKSSVILSPSHSQHWGQKNSHEITPYLLYGYWNLNLVHMIMPQVLLTTGVIHLFIPYFLNLQHPLNVTCISFPDSKKALKNFKFLRILTH